MVEKMRMTMTHLYSFSFQDGQANVGRGTIQNYITICNLPSMDYSNVEILMNRFPNMQSNFGTALLSGFKEKADKEKRSKLLKDCTAGIIITEHFQFVLRRPSG